jgi:hypothetical protein
MPGNRCQPCGHAQIVLDHNASDRGGAIAARIGAGRLGISRAWLSVVHRKGCTEVVMRCVSILIFIALFARTAAAGERAGVTMADAITVEGKPLVLNGMGIRKATIFRIKAYVAGLYLERRSRNAAEIVRSEQVKRLDVVMLRDVDRGDAIDAWRTSLKKNGADMAKLKAWFDQFAGWIPDMAERDTLSFLYVPGGGVTMFVKGQRKGTIAGGDFASALFSIWLGSDPADESLKNELLGN